MTVDVNNESGAAVDEVALAELGQFLLDALGINPLAELSVVLVDTDAMAALHEQWMDLPGPTDVMAFPMDLSDPGDPDAPDSHGPSAGDVGGSVALLGDVVLCPQVAGEQARQAGHSAEAELLLLCTHGVLHLLGYDHGEEDEEREMFELQADLVRRFAGANGRGPVHTPVPGSGGQARDVQGSGLKRGGR